MQSSNEYISHSLSTLPVRQLLKEYALPTMFSLSAEAVFNICDLIFIGQGIGIKAMAGLVITFPFVTLLTGIGAFITAGGATQTVIHMGKDDRETAIDIFGNVLNANITIGVLVTLIGLTLCDDILRLFGASEVTLPYASDYMEVMLMSTLFIFSGKGMIGQLRAIGHAKLAMRIRLMSILLNLVLDPIFIFGLGMGIRGAAIATVISVVAEWFYLIHLFHDKEMYVHIRRRSLHLNKEIMKKIAVVGASPLITNTVGCLVVLTINRVLIAMSGAESVIFLAAYSIVQRIGQVVVQLTVGLGRGMLTVVSFNFTKQLFARVRQALILVIRQATLSTCVVYILVLLLTKPIASIFVTDPRQLEICIPALYISLCTFPFVAGQIIAISFFQAIRVPWASMTISLTRQLMILVPLLLILPQWIGVNGVWWSMSIADIFSVTLTWVMLWLETKKLCI